MILYRTGVVGVGFVFRCHGSVFPKALCWALPNAAMAFLLHYFFHVEDDTKPHWMTGVNVLFASWAGVLGFLVVFRNNLAHDRFWEGATLISQVRGVWFNAASNLVAFCSKDPMKRGRILHFQHLLVRLCSMLYCAALQQVCDLDEHTLEIIDPQGINADSLEYLSKAQDRCEVILQWIQQLIVDADKGKVIDIAPPILSRVFQELSNGIVALNSVRKINDIPFPFPYSQMITCMFMLQVVFTPIFAAFVIHARIWAAIMCFLYTFAYACLLYIPNEIEQPFGSDANDLPLEDMLRAYNTSLMALLEPLMQQAPQFEYETNKEIHLVEEVGSVSPDWLKPQDKRKKRNSEHRPSSRDSLTSQASVGSRQSRGSMSKEVHRNEGASEKSGERPAGFQEAEDISCKFAKKLQAMSNSNGEWVADLEKVRGEMRISPQEYGALPHEAWRQRPRTPPRTPPSTLHNPPTNQLLAAPVKSPVSLQWELLPSCNLK